MTDDPLQCSRCGRSEADGATIQEGLDGHKLLCLPCVDYLQDDLIISRRADQAGLEDYS